MHLARPAAEPPAQQAERRLARTEPQPLQPLPPGLRLRAGAEPQPPRLPAALAASEVAAAAALPVLAPAPVVSLQPGAGLSPAAFGGHPAGTHPWLVTGRVMLLVPLG